MGKSGQLYMEMMEQMCPAERMRLEDQSYAETPHDYATSQPEWHDTLGSCLELIWSVLKKEDDWGIISAFNLFHSVGL